MNAPILRLLIAVPFCLLATACMFPTKRAHLDECYELAQESLLIRTKCPAWMNEYVIAAEGDGGHSMGGCLDFVVESLPVGERVDFMEVFYDFQGATGSCWRVLAELPNRPEFNVVEIPSCFPEFRQPEGWTTVEDGVVQVNPERLRKCSN